MEPLIKLNNKNNLFDCTIHKTAATPLDGNQGTAHHQEQHSVSILSTQRSPKEVIEQDAYAGHHRQPLTQLIIL